MSILSLKHQQLQLISSTRSNSSAQGNKKHIYVFGSFGWNLALAATCLTYTKVWRSFTINDWWICLSYPVCSQIDEIIHFHCKKKFGHISKLVRGWYKYLRKELDLLGTGATWSWSESWEGSIHIHPFSVPACTRMKMPKVTFNIVYTFKKRSKVIPSLLCVSMQKTALPPPALIGIKAVSCVCMTSCSILMQ